MNNLTQQKKFCPLCESDLPIARFDAHKPGSSGLYHCCKKCRKANKENPRVKWCNKCGEWKVFSEFTVCRSKWDNLCTFCRDCNKQSCHVAHKANPERMFDRHFKTTYGISVEQVRQMAVEQSDLCGICGKPEHRKLKGQTKRLAVDHNHQTGEVRGLLCSDCNRALGMFKDDTDILLKAVEYLRANER